MAGSGRLQSDPLFQGLTRPTMIFGVSYMFFVLNMAICLVIFINSQSFLILLGVMPVLHLCAYIICLKEPRALEMFMVKMKKGLKCLNRVYHGNTNSYDLY
ncbi:MAG: VirB3 family type IV secretion system protein [Alphaproteobacteria bacterium]|nr:VirB3 family type IV secretion system protein [Alphaproteobacteria bacterium]